MSRHRSEQAGSGGGDSCINDGGNIRSARLGQSGVVGKCHCSVVFRAVAGAEQDQGNDHSEEGDDEK